MSQTIRATPSKAKRGTKERDKRKSLAVNQDSNNVNTSDKPLPSKDSHSKRYAGLSTENIRVAAEHIALPDLVSEESLEVLAEDLNYKLRYIIHQASNRAFTSNRNGINSKDIEETFEDLQLDKVYGAVSDPSWIPLQEQHYLILDDPRVNLLEDIEEVPYSQQINPVINKTWLQEPKEPNNSLKNYFKIMCEALVLNDLEVRRMALQNISSNPNIGPIINWFYRFGYVLLSKDVTYDSLTFYALDLIETLEMCPLGNTEADPKQLKFLVRLILQRLLKSYTNPKVLKPMCWVLSILCGRYPLKEFVITKLKQKLYECSDHNLLPFLMLINASGVDAINDILVRNFEFIFNKLNGNIEEKSLLMNGKDENINKLSYNWQLYGYTLMETYYTLVKNDIYHKKFNEFSELENFIIILSKRQESSESEEIMEMNFINVRKQLIKTRRKLEVQHQRRSVPYESVFEISSRMKQKMANHYKTNYHMCWKKQSNVVIGKTSLLLPVMINKNPKLPHCNDHSLFFYNL